MQGCDSKKLIGFMLTSEEQVKAKKNNMQISKRFVTQFLA